MKSSTLSWCVWLSLIHFIVPGDPQPVEGSGAAEQTPAANQTNPDPSAAVDQEVS